MPDSDIIDIPTVWSEVIRTQHQDEVIAREAMIGMIDRYSSAIKRYVRVFFRDPNNADDVYQKFVERLIKGDLRNACPEKGSFRLYLKTVLRNLIRSHQAEMRKQLRQPPEPISEAHDADPTADRIDEELRIWRDEVVGRAWQHLEHQDQSHGRDIPRHVLLHYRSEHAKVPLSEVAEYFSMRSGTVISEAKIRSLLHEARRALRSRIYFEVAETVAYPSVDNVEQEIINLGLHKWLASTIEEIRGRRGAP